MDGKALEELRLQGWPSRLCFRSNAAPNNAALLVCLLWQHRISGRIGTRILCCPALHDLRTCTRWGSTLHHPPQSLHSVRPGAWKVWPRAFASGPLLPRLDHSPPEPVHGEGDKHACCGGFPVEVLVDTMHVSRPYPVVLLQDLFSFEESFEVPQLPSGDGDANQQREDAEPRHP